MFCQYLLLNHLALIVPMRVSGEKRAWYTLFVYAQVPQDF